LYVATVTKIFLIDVSAKDKESKSELDSLGAKDGTYHFKMINFSIDLVTLKYFLLFIY
jgi:hypothetical protein